MARKVKFDFRPQQIAGVRIKESKTSVMRQVRDFVKSSILDKVSKQTSPVSGNGSYRGLSKAYKGSKSAKGGRPVPNLRLTSRMLDSLRVSQLTDNVVRVTVTDSQQPKADGHNNFTGRSRLPRRAFVPDERRGETLKQDIIQGIKRIVKGG